MLSFCIYPSLSLTPFLKWVPWLTHLAGAGSIWDCQSPVQGENTLLPALEQTWQHWCLLFFHRTMTFAYCGLQGSFSRNVKTDFSSGPMFPTGSTYSLLLEQSPCWGSLNSWWWQMSTKEDGRSIGKCSPETWISVLGKIQSTALYLRRNQTLPTAIPWASPHQIPL